ncbi:hypothetical protein [Streptomyces sp. RFCAC02]|uniref:hypothetical protein n=1 Tax=Streptomyces sp. RFCAC02 TaxID=2499143 RepID=UPI001F0E8718|nr:hypothetical protein [Streptomyces sp. RFCAC02]
MPLRAEAARAVGIRAAALTVLLVLLQALLPPTAARAAQPTAAGTPGFCPGAAGVTVVVDFRELGGGQVVRCAPDAPADGLAALRAAGFEITGTSRWGDSFVCRINGRPGVDAEPCTDTPPASAYWSYWHAENGGSWTYSQRGASYRTPAEGTFEGWSFSLDREMDDAPPPGVAPVRPVPDDGGDGGGGDDGDDGGTAPGGSGGSSSGSSGSDSGAGPDPGSTAGTDPSDGDGGNTPPAGQPSAPGADPSPDDAPTPDDDATATPDDGPTGPDDDATTPAPADGTTAPAPSEAPAWSGEDEEFEQERAERDGSSRGPSPATVAVLALVAALAAGGALAARRRRRTAEARTDDAA